MYAFINLLQKSINSIRIDVTCFVSKYVRKKVTSTSKIENQVRNVEKEQKNPEKLKNDV